MYSIPYFIVLLFNGGVLFFVLAFVIRAYRFMKTKSEYDAQLITKMDELIESIGKLNNSKNTYNKE